MCDPIVIIHDTGDLGRSPPGGRPLWVRDRWKHHLGYRVYVVEGRKREREERRGERREKEAASSGEGQRGGNSPALAGSERLGVGGACLFHR